MQPGVAINTPWHTSQKYTALHLSYKNQVVFMAFSVTDQSRKNSPSENLQHVFHPRLLALLLAHNLKISRWFHNLYFCDILIVFVEWTAILVHPSHSTRAHVNLPEDHSSCWGSTETLHWHFLSQALTWLLDLDSGSSHMTTNCEALMLLFLTWNLQKNRDCDSFETILRTQHHQNTNLDKASAYEVN